MPKMYNEEGEVIYAGRGKRSRNARTLIAQRKAYIHNDEGQLVVYVPEDPGTSDPARTLNMDDDIYLPMMEHFTEQNQVVLSSFEQSIRDLSTIAEYTVEPNGKFMEFQLNDTGEKIAKIENQGKKVKITFFKDLSGSESFEKAGAKLSSSNTVFELENAPGKLASHPIHAVRELFSELVAPRMIEPEESTTEISTEKTD